MPADTLIERNALIEQVAMAISRSAATRPRKEGTVMRFRRYAEAAVGVLEQHYAEKARTGGGDRMTHYRAQPEDDAVLIVLCAVRDGQFGKSALNEVIDLWVAGQIGRTDSTQGAVSANDDAFQVICDALSALQPPQARELMETPSYKAFAAFYKRGQ